MAELHRFSDRYKDPKRQSDPLDIRSLDENFTWTRAKVGESLSALIKRTENAPAADKLECAAPPTGTYFLYIRNGVIELLEVPSSGQYYVKFVDGSATTIERDTCS